MRGKMCDSIFLIIPGLLTILLCLAPALPALSQAAQLQSTQATQPEGGTASVRLPDILADYDRWNLVVLILALLGLLVLSRLRFKAKHVQEEEKEDLQPLSGSSLTVAMGQSEIVPRVRLVRLSPVETAPGEIVLTQDDVLIGRGQECDVVIGHPSVSRAHARVRLSKQGYILFDLKSKTGTYINERRIEENLLRKGLVVRIGEVEYYCHESALQSS